jgi:hypothetical protein
VFPKQSCLASVSRGSLSTGKCRRRKDPLESALHLCIRNLSGITPHGDAGFVWEYRADRVANTPHCVGCETSGVGGFATGLEVVTLTCADNKKILAALAPGMKSGGYM